MKPNDDQILLSPRSDAICAAAGASVCEIFSLVFDPILGALGPHQGLIKKRDGQPKPVTRCGIGEVLGTGTYTSR
jgi:hypothetical protein